MRLSAQFPAQLVAIHARHHNIDKQQIGAVLLVEFAPLDPVSGLDDAEPVIFEGGPEQRADDGIVVDDEHRGRRFRMGFPNSVHRCCFVRIARGT